MQPTTPTAPAPHPARSLRPPHGVRAASTRPFAPTALAAAALVLAVEPAVWLVRTWTHPAFDSSGGWVFAAVVGLLVWSVRSGAPTDDGHHRRRAYALLVLTAAVRAVGHLLAVDVLGGAALAVDVYAIGVLLRLDSRPRPVSPGWLALLFAFTLPVERILQRVVGFPLQLVSAKGACGVLSLTHGDVACSGIRLTLSGHDVLVDLPCSGTQGVFLVGAVFVGLAAVRRPRRTHALVGALVTTASALWANALRIAALAGGMSADGAIAASFRDGVAHEVVGIVALALALVPVVAWSWWVDARPADRRSSRRAAPLLPESPAVRFGTGLVATAAVATVLAVPPRPIDTSRVFPELALPIALAGHPGEPERLSDAERDAYEAHGGTAQRARYGDHALLVVRTSSPLRHLHSPEECMAGVGATVRRVGIVWSPVPAAVYRVTSPDGDEFRVSVTYVDTRGRIATSVAEVVWHWLRDPGPAWTGVQRISPWALAETEGLLVERQVAGIFDLPS